MPIDASIYGNLQPVQAPNVMDQAQKAMALSNMGMQNQQAQLQMQTQQAMRQAYQDNTNPDGSMNRQGLLSQIGRVNPQAAMQMAQQFNTMDKAQAEKQAAQADSAMKTLTVTGPAFDALAAMPEDQRAKAYSGYIQQLKDQGIDVSKMDHPYDSGLFNQYYSAWRSSKPSLENQVAQSTINKQNQESDMLGVKQGAEELAKFNEDANNPTTRKTTGSLIGARDRADRLIALSNAGANPGETPQQRLARLNSMIPQLANEYNAGLSYLFQGGQPSETQLKETGLDTVQSKIASLKQKLNGTPQSGDQGALIEAYIDAAQKLRDFSAGRLKDINDRSRAAYPFANKYFPKEMDRIASPINSPAYVGSTATLAGGGSGSGGGVGLFNNANASDSTVKAPPKFNAGDIVMRGGKHYTIGSDGDTLIPVKGSNK